MVDIKKIEDETVKTADKGISWYQKLSTSSKAFVVIVVVLLVLGGLVKCIAG